MVRHAWVALVGGAAVVLAAAGCEQGPLTRDDEVRLLTAENARLQEQLLASQQRVAELTASGARPTPIPRLPEDPYRAVAIRFGGTTGSLDSDGRPGDDRLKVVLEPLDAEGDVVKRAGALVLEAFAVGADGRPARPWHRWHFPLEDLAQTWIGTLGIRAYVLKMPWPDGQPPAGGRLWLRATFTTIAGQDLTAEREVTVKTPATADAPKK